MYSSPNSLITHRSLGYRNRDLPTIDWPPYSSDLNLIEHVWSWIKRYIQEHYFQAYYDAKKISLDELKRIVLEAWNAVLDSYIRTLFESW